MKSLLICPDERTEVSAISETSPLSNISILGKPLLEYWIEHLVTLGAREIFILATDRPEQVRALVGDGARWGVRVTVFPEIRELSVAQANVRYCGNQCEGWLDAPNHITVIDHLPGLAAHPLFASYAHWMTALENQMPRSVTRDRIGLQEIKPGVWIGLHARIAPSAKLQPPCWIGENVFVGENAVIGPTAILEKGAFIEKGAKVTHSVVEPETFVGENTELHHSIACGSTLINWKMDSAIKISDAFLLCSLAATQRAFQPIGPLSRVTAFWALLVTAPLALFPILRQRLRGRRAFRPLLAVRPQLRGTLPVTGDTMVYYELRNTRGWLRRWPQLWSIVRGQFAWVGNRPLSPKQAGRLRNESERLWLTTRLGLLCLADTEAGCDLCHEESRAHATYYAVHANWRLDWKIFLRAVFLFIFGVSVSRTRDACSRFLHLQAERKAY